MATTTTPTPAQPPTDPTPQSGIDRWFEVTARGSDYRGVSGKYPFALASGLGLNAFAAAEVAAHHVTWSSMMGIFVIDGGVIIVLVVLGLRERIIDTIPFDLKLGIGIGIGAFITVVGLKNAGFVIAGGELGTLGTHLGTWKMLVFALGLLVTWDLFQRGVRGALLFGILGATVERRHLGQRGA